MTSNDCIRSNNKQQWTMVMIITIYIIIYAHIQIIYLNIVHLRYSNTYTLIYIYIYTYAHTHIHTYTNIHVYTYTHYIIYNYRLGNCNDNGFCDEGECPGSYYKQSSASNIELNRIAAAACMAVAYALFN